MRLHLYKLLNNHYIEHFPVENMCLDNLAILRGEFSNNVDSEKSLAMQNTNIKRKNVNTNHDEVITKKRCLSAGYISSEDSQLSSKKFNKSQIDDKYYAKNRVKILKKKREYYTANRQKILQSQKEKFQTSSDQQKRTIKSTFKILEMTEDFIQKLAENLNSKSDVDSRMESEKIIRNCLNNRKNMICQLKRKLKSIKEIAEGNITKLKDCDSSIQSPVKKTHACCIHVTYV